MTKKNIIFLDYGPSTGLGHLNRCKYFEKYLKLKSTLYVSEKKINQRGVQNINLSIDKFLNTNKQKFNIGIIDSYQISYNQECKIKKICKKLITIDDLAKRRFCCDILINYNPAITYKKYLTKTKKNTKLLLGEDFNFIYNLNYKKKIIKNKINILIYFGTRDRTHFIKKKIIDKLFINKNKINNITILSKFKFKHKFFKIKFKYFENNSKTLQEINNSDVCILSSGIIIYEALNYNKIIFSKPISNNQEPHFKYLLKKKLIFSLNKLKKFKFVENKIFNFNISNNEPDQYIDKSKILKLVINPIKSKDNKNIYLMKYDKKYDHELYDMQTPFYRKFYINKESFSFKDHKIYLSKIKKRNIQLYIIKCINRFSGYIKFEIKERKVYVSIAVKKEYQNKKIGFKILQYLMKNNFFKIKPYAEIDKNNFASIKVFKNAGFKAKNIKIF